MKTRPYFLSASLLAAVLAVACPASAQNAEKEAAADVLFREGKKYAEANDWEHACPKFIESERLSPSVGTLLNIGNCYEKAGKLASAYGAFREAEVMARTKGDQERQGEAARRAEALAPKLAKLEIVVPGATRAIPGLTIKKEGGAVIGEGQWGTPLPADVGNYTIEASAPGYKTWTTTIRIAADGSSASVWVPALEKGDATASPFWNGQRIAGITIGSVGVVVGAVVGSIFAVRAGAKNIESKLNCSPTDPNFCNDAGVSLRKDAQTAATVSTAAVVAGGVVAAGGLVVLLTAPSPAKREAPRMTLAPQITPSMIGLVARTRF